MLQPFPTRERTKRQQVYFQGGRCIRGHVHQNYEQRVGENLQENLMRVGGIDAIFFEGRKVPVKQRECIWQTGYAKVLTDFFAE